MASTRKSLALSFAQKYTNLIVQLASTMLIARLLTPHELGIFWVAAAVVGLANAVRDFGVNNYLIQEPVLTPVRLRTAFTVSLAMSWTMALSVYLGGSLVAGLYGEPGLAQVMTVMAATLVVMPFGIPVTSKLQREMQFGALYWINCGGGIAMPLVTIALALLGYGYMSLAWGSVAGALVTTVIALTVWREHVTLRPSLTEWRRVLSFGGQSSAIGLLHEISMRSKSLIIGGWLGFAATAIFERAEKILAIYRLGVAEGLVPVVLPAFSATHRDGADARAGYLTAMTHLTAFTWPFFLCLAFMAHPAVLLLFGDQWTDAVPIVQILCLYGMISPWHHLNPQILIAVGEIRRNLVVQATCLPILLVGLLWAATDSLMTVAAVSVVVAAIKATLFHRSLARVLDFRLGDLVRATGASATIAAGAALAPLAVVLLLGPEPNQPLLALGLAGIGAFALWSGLLWLTDHPLKAEYLRAKRSAIRQARIGLQGRAL